MKKLALVHLILLWTSLVFAQHTEEGTVRKNVIKLDLTSHLLYKNAFVISYERITKPHQSFVITGGIQQFKPFENFGYNIQVKSNFKSSGLRFGGDYRFYLKKENRYDAPRGIYLGPYFTFHHFINERNIEVNNNGTPETGNLNLDLNIGNVGVQLGYQFVIKNRWVIDVVFVGPSITRYQAKINLDENLTSDPGEITNQVLDALIDRFPGLGDLINKGEVTSDGNLNKWAYGYRYQVQIGYQFGRKSKK